MADGVLQKNECEENEDFVNHKNGDKKVVEAIAAALTSDRYIEELKNGKSKPYNAQQNADSRRGRAEGEIQVSLMDYLHGELRRGYLLENDEQRYTDRREKFYMFMKIPREIEKFIFYGYFQCADAFLYIFTFLPLRFILSIWLMLSRLLRRFISLFSMHRSGMDIRLLQPAEICDLLKGIILVTVSFLLTYVDTSMLYHTVKSQSVMKLYIFFNMLEVADKLFSSFGQDILDALFWTATEPRGRKREHLGLLPHLAMAICYVFMHTILVLLQATTLNVAINSQNKALLTVMLFNNFVELKGMVFKKFEKNNLFQMSCSDVRERFHYTTLLFVVVIVTMKEYNWQEDHFWVLIPDCILVLVAELMVDWVKHGFITRFNEISLEVYREYTVSLAYDLASSKLKNAYSDHSDLVSRRMAFIPLPLGALVIRVVVGSVTMKGAPGVLCFVLIYMCLMSCKVLSNILLLGKACDLIEEHRQALKEKLPQKRQYSSLPSSRHQSMEDLRKAHQPKSTPHSPSRSNSSSLQDISAHAEILQQSMEPNPIFTNSTVSLNSLGLDEHIFEQHSALLKATAVEDAKSVPKHMRRVSLQEMSTNRS